MDGRMGGWGGGWGGGWVDGWMGVWMDGWMAGWMDGWDGFWIDRQRAFQQKGQQRASHQLAEELHTGFESSAIAICPIKAHGTQWLRTASHSKHGRSLSRQGLGFNRF